MIEIKNKRMLLFPEDRIIGVAGDINTAERKFVLDRVQNGFDLSSFVAWLKLEASNGDEAYSQLIKKEVVGERIVLTWLLSGANLKQEGELSVQVVLASPDYFSEEDLENLKDGQTVLPSTIEGVSAPVWQSHKETFVIDSSIDDTAAYSEVTKNVLVSALANIAQSVEKTEELYEECESTKTAVSMMYSSVCENMEYAETLRSAAESAAISAQESAQLAEVSGKSAEESAAAAEKFKKDAMDYSEIAITSADDCTAVLNQVADIHADCEKLLQQAASSMDYSLIFSKTLTEEDTGYAAFEIDKDINGESISLKEFCFFVYIPAILDAQSSYLRLDIKCEGNDNFLRISQFSGISSSSDTYLRIEAQKKGRWTTKYSKASAWFQNAESVSVGGTLCSANRTSDGKCANAVKLLQHSAVNADFPVGTHIELWGINSVSTEEGADE